MIFDCERGDVRFEQIDINQHYIFTMAHKLTVLPYIIKFSPKTPALSKILNIYGFDLDHTIIQPKTPNVKFSRNADDWKFMKFGPEKFTIDKLIDIVVADTDAQIVIFSNQGGIVSVPATSKSCTKFTEKIQNMLKAIKEIPNGELLLDKLWIYASTKKPASLFPTSKSFKKKGSTTDMLGSSNEKNKVTKKPPSGVNAIKHIYTNALRPDLFTKMRKPNTGMFDYFNNDISSDEIKLNWKFYCGDAAGRKADFSDSDKIFAENLKVTFKLPEDVF